MIVFASCELKNLQCVFKPEHLAHATSGVNMSFTFPGTPNIGPDEDFCYSCGKVFKKNDPCVCEQYYRKMDKNTIERADVKKKRVINDRQLRS